MLRALCVLVTLCAVAVAQGGKKGAREQEDQRQAQEIRDLTRELRELASRSPSGVARASDQKRIIEAIAGIGHPQAVRVLVAYAGDPNYMQIRQDLLRILSEIRGADESVIVRVMKEHIALGDPARAIAREYLLKQAARIGKDDFPNSLFYMGTLEDKFLALQVMGRIRSDHAIECATTLAKDKSWSPDATGLVSCGTIALSVERLEGPLAAELLLTLTKNPRFTPADADKLRQAMRTWRQTDLRAYVDLAKLSKGDAIRRQETAQFLGAVGLEVSRAPLLRVAFNRREVPEVRAAAATALGGLRIAREDLAEQLKRLLLDPERMVRDGAMAGLGRLNVRQAAEALVSMLDGPFGAEIDATLSRLTNMPQGTDWRKWVLEAFPADS